MSIVASMRMVGNNTNKTGNLHLKIFKTTMHSPKSRRFIKVFWQPPSLRWIKCNIDGVVMGIHSLCTYEAIFQNDNNDHVKSCFSLFIDLGNALMAKLTGVILDMKLTLDKY